MSFDNTSSFRRWRSSMLAVAVLGLTLFFGASANAQVSSLTQSFDVVPAPGWTTQNNSVPVGTTSWFQGTATSPFPPQAGTGYIGANFNATTGANTISLWLISPHVNLVNGAQFKFWTRTVTANPFPDRLQVRMSTAGASTNVGTGPTGIGDFTNLLIDINPTYNTGGGPPPANYPEVWTEVTLTVSGVSAGATGRFAFRYFVEDGGPAGDNSNYIGIDTVSYTTAAPVAANGPVDYNGDGKTDYAVVRNIGGGANGQLRWFYNPSGTATTIAKDWGLAGDFIISGNWDTDNQDDIVVWRPGAATVAAFYVLRSTNFTAIVEPFGQTGDNPTVVADYTGDGRTDFAVYRGSAATWFYRSAATLGGPVFYVRWGQAGDFVAPGDYDGNGSADFAVQRPNAGGGDFWIRLSTGAVLPVQRFGLSSDLVVPGDYDGDGKTDLAVARGVSGALNWYWRPSGGGADQQVAWGASATDFTAQGDYDGDGKIEPAVWRPSATAGASAFYVRGSAGTTLIVPFGQNLDYPVANFNSH